MKANEMKALKKALNKFGKTVVSRSKKKRGTDSKLAKSISFDPVEVTSDGFEIAFRMESYGKFVDLGVKGKNPSGLPKGSKNYGKQKAPLSPYKFGSGKYKGNLRLRDAIGGWVIKKGIAPRDKSGKFTKRKSLIFLITRSIYMTGIKPSLFFTTPFNIAFKQLPKDIKETFALDVEKLFKQTTEQ
jgi:hypothetical protein